YQPAVMPGWSARWADTTATAAAALALCTPALPGWLAATAWQLMRGSAPAPRMWGSYPHAPAFALYSTYSLIHRHCLRPRIVRRVVRHDPRPVHPGGPVNNASFRRAIGAIQTAAATPAPFLVRFAQPKTQNPKPKNSSGRRPQKSTQVAAVFPGPFVPARRLAKPIASFG